MNTFQKIASAAVLTGAVAIAAATPSQARDWHYGGAAAAGFAAGAIVGAAASSAANNAYYGGGYYGGYAYDPGYGPGYHNDYAYPPAPAYGYPYQNWNSQGPGCIQSPASHSYTSCN